jgi:hypothetical protein
MRVKLQLDAVLFEDDLAKLIGSANHGLPFFAGQFRRLQIGPGLVVTISRHRHKNDVLRSHGSGKGCNIARHFDDF